MIGVNTAWDIYLQIRLHFLYDRDLFYGNNAKKRLPRNLQERPDKILMRSVITEFTTERQIVEFCLANYLYENDSFLYDDQETAMTFYRKWKKYWDAGTYNFNNDMSVVEMQQMTNGIDSMRQCIIDSGHKSVLLNKMCRETLCVIAMQDPELFKSMVGFEIDRLKNRVIKTLPFIKSRLSKIQNFEFT
jgi:hypothetical protein